MGHDAYAPLRAAFQGFNGIASLLLPSAKQTKLRDAADLKAFCRQRWQEFQAAAKLESADALIHSQSDGNKFRRSYGTPTQERLRSGNRKSLKRLRERRWETERAHGNLGQNRLSFASILMEKRLNHQFP
jgi:hypothetical protein